MKKTFIFGLMAAALGFTACSSDDDLNVINNTQKGMVLRATVEQPTETRATINDSGTTWKFAFATDDNVSVTNSAVAGTYYTFVNDERLSRAKMHRLLNPKSHGMLTSHRMRWISLVSQAQWQT